MKAQLVLRLPFLGRQKPPRPSVTPPSEGNLRFRIFFSETLDIKLSRSRIPEFLVSGQAQALGTFVISENFSLPSSQL